MAPNAVLAHARSTPVAKAIKGLIQTNQPLSRHIGLLSAKSVIDAKEGEPRIVFPGGGIYFFWQAGAVSFLTEHGYSLSHVSLSGASAGAIAATLTATEVNFVEATERAFELGREAGVLTRPLGLLGVWGKLIERWLHDILPKNAADLSNDRLSLLLTPFPSVYEKRRVSRFKDKSDLIRCNLASAHLPYFLDGRLTRMYGDVPHIDGSFLTRISDHCPEGDDNSVVVLDWKNDEIMAGKKTDFVRLKSEDCVWSLFEQGRAYAELMDMRGHFDCLPLK